MTPWFATLPCFIYWDFSTKEAYHAIRFEKDTRYYSMRLEKDLFDDWILIATNGRIQSRLGQTRSMPHLSFLPAFDELCDKIEVRLKRGYRLVSYRNDDPLLLQLLPFTPIKNHLKEKIIRASRVRNSNTTATNNQNHSEIQPTYIQTGFAF